MKDSGCLHDPQTTLGPIGMYHCPDCGEMQIAGFVHTKIMEKDDWFDCFMRAEIMKLDLTENEL